MSCSDADVVEELAEYVTEDSISSSHLEQVVEEKVIKEMKKTNVHPEAAKKEVETYADEIRRRLINIQTDEQLEEIEIRLDAIEGVLEGQQNIQAEYSGEKRGKYTQFVMERIDESAFDVDVEQIIKDLEEANDNG